jgi:hypothetical protein
VKTKIDEVVIEGKTYSHAEQFREQQDVKGDIKIVILQRGWVMIGRFERKGSDCTLHNAYNVRRWGTERGLGELAYEGKKEKTVLDKCYGVVQFDYLTVIATIDCREEKWEKEL